MVVRTYGRNQLVLKAIPALMAVGIIGLCGVMPVGAEGLSNNTRTVTKDEQITG